jgi:hypothetical protein
VRSLHIGEGTTAAAIPGRGAVFLKWEVSCSEWNMAGKSAPTRRAGTLIDVDTGQGFVVKVEAGPGASYGKRWCIMFDDARQQIINQLNSLPTVRVFLALPDYLSWTEFRPLNQSKLAERLKVGAASVSRAMKDLHGRGIVERLGRGPVMQWKLSLNWGWRGNAAAYHAAVREAETHRLQAGQRPSGTPMYAA